MRLSARAAATVAALTALLGSAALMLGGTTATSAQWNDQVELAATASTGTWAAPPDALGKFVIESMQGGTWVDDEYYGASIQLRNDDTDVRPLAVEDITSGTVTVTFRTVDVGSPQPAIIANAGGSSPSVPLPATDPTWTAGSVVDNGDGTTTYTLEYVGAVAGQGVTRVTFGILGSTPLHSGVTVTVTATGSPTDGTVSTRTVTIN